MTAVGWRGGAAYGVGVRSARLGRRGEPRGSRLEPMPMGIKVGGGSSRLSMVVGRAGGVGGRVISKRSSSLAKSCQPFTTRAMSASAAGVPPRRLLSPLFADSGQNKGRAAAPPQSTGGEGGGKGKMEDGVWPAPATRALLPNKPQAANAPSRRPSARPARRLSWGRRRSPPSSARSGL
ncbi:hypothetical protein CDD83_5818 [Cordyceps sp. RAO-2017]|nr:hypothetical protein CDD83_5818 [Cordyceps sp. RAO-2017]